MEIQSCPVLHPTEQQFSDFYAYIHLLDQKYKKDYGMVKIVPPPRWRPQAKNYEKRLQHLSVKNPIEQNVQGTGGFYESKNIVQEKMTFKAYRRYAQRESKKVADITTPEKEKMFWKTITYSPPIYGADLTGTLMDENAGQWNFNSLNSLLRYALVQKVKGVTEPYCYIGTWKAFFSWHKEDLDLAALNYIHEGAPKIWYSIAKDNCHILEQEAREHFKAHADHCPEFLRHKTFLINPLTLLQRHKNLKVTKIEHNPGEIMMVFGGAYHTGFNLGFNIAEAVNYATIDWLSELINIHFCKCFRKSVRGEIESILYNLQHSQLYAKLLNTKVFQALRAYVLKHQDVQDGQQNVNQPAIIINIEIAKKKEKKVKQQQQWTPPKMIQNSASDKRKAKASISLKIKKTKNPQKTQKKASANQNAQKKQSQNFKKYKSYKKQLNQKQTRKNHQFAINIPPIKIGLK